MKCVNCSYNSLSQLLIYHQGPCLVEWMPEVCLDSALPSRTVPRGRPYSNITYDASTGLLVAAASLKTRFVMFDEDGNTLWGPDGEQPLYRHKGVSDKMAPLAPNIGDPCMECSTLELISPDDWATMDG
jgi:cleavage and polyadenylation specificity factor subunit 1